MIRSLACAGCERRDIWQTSSRQRNHPWFCFSKYGMSDAHIKFKDYTNQASKLLTESCLVIIVQRYTSKVGLFTITLQTYATRWAVYTNLLHWWGNNLRKNSLCDRTIALFPGSSPLLYRCHKQLGSDAGRIPEEGFVGGLVLEYGAKGSGISAYREFPSPVGYTRPCSKECLLTGMSFSGDHTMLALVVSLTVTPTYNDTPAYVHHL